MNDFVAYGAVCVASSSALPAHSGLLKHNSHAPGLQPLAGLSLRVLHWEFYILGNSVLLDKLEYSSPRDNQANPFTPIRPLLRSCFLSVAHRFPPSPLHLPLPLFTFLKNSTYHLLVYYVLYILTIFMVYCSPLSLEFSTMRAVYFVFWFGLNAENKTWQKDAQSILNLWMNECSHFCADCTRYYREIKKAKTVIPPL